MADFEGGKHWRCRCSPHRRAVLFHTAPYPAGYRLFEEFPGRTTFGDPKPHFLTTEELERTCDSTTAPRLFDARDAARFRGDREPIDPVAGHIAGATNMPFADSLNEDGTWKAPAALRRIWSRALGEDPELPWGVMCGSGVTACHLALSAVIAGYEEPRLYVGSWSEWIREPRRAVTTSAG